MRDSLERIFENAAAGRGFWAGLYPVGAPLSPRVVATDASQHVTLAHFGRGVSPDVVDRVVRACRDLLASRTPGAVLARSWATARMDQKAGSVIAILLEGDDLVEFRHALLRCCGAKGVRVDQRFAFHPHLTIQRIGRREPATISGTDRIDFQFEALSLVCGDAREDFDLRAIVAADPDQISLPF